MSDSVLPLPKTRSAIEDIQRRQMRLAFHRAAAAPFFKGKLDHVNADKLDDPAEWRKIPILDKEALRALSDEDFYTQFCDGSRSDIQQYWRSGGSTGRPLFYPRTRDDIRYAMAGFARLYGCTGTADGHSIHNSFPMGIHPIGQMLARAGEESGLAMTWAGAGTAAPSAIQLQLIEMLKPTLWMGMSSFGQHLANLADSMGNSVEGSTVERIICSAEPLTKSKRQKLERSWGAEVFDCYGMTECALMGAESPAHDGFHVWTDLAHFEVLDEESFEPVAPGTPGVLIMTPLYVNEVTPFLRWNTGDIVIYKDEGDWDGPFSVFPTMRHAHRTSGFFKIRGVNVNHTEFEDFMFSQASVNEFRVEVLTAGGIDKIVIALEIKHGSDEGTVVGSLINEVKNTFEITPEVCVISAGTLVDEFARSVKPQRFVDSRA